VKLDVNQTLTQNLTLQVGASTDTVTVSADSAAVMVQRSIVPCGTTNLFTIARVIPAVFRQPCARLSRRTLVCVTVWGMGTAV
jgi:hypothetical protein